METNDKIRQSKKTKKNRWIIAVSLIAILAFSAVGVFIFLHTPSSEQEPQSAKSVVRPAVVVSKTQIQTETWPKQLTAYGNVAAWQEATIGSDLDNLRLVSVNCNVGDHVQKDQVLAAFDEEPVRIAVAKAKATLMQAEAALKEAKQNAQRARRLEGSGAMSSQVITQYLTAEEVAIGIRDTAKASLADELLRLKRTKVRAPANGTISQRHAALGTVTNSGGELFRLIIDNRMEWRAELSSAELATLSLGVRTEVTLPNGEKLHGTVRNIAPDVANHSRLGIAFVDLPSHHALRAGSFIPGTFLLGESVVQTLPQKAVVLRDGYHYVFAIETDHHVRAEKVQTGRRYGNRIEILSPLDPQANFAVSGAGFLNDGDLVGIAVQNEPVPVPHSIATKKE